MARSRIVLSAAALTLAAGLAQAQSFSEHFDMVDPLFTTGGWFGQNNSDDPDPTYTAWQQGVDFRPTREMFAHSGDPTSYALANYQATLGSLGTEDISLWMIPPTVTLRNGDQIKFWTQCIPPGATIYPDRMQVRLSTAGASTNVGTGPLGVGDFTTLLMDINPNYSMNQTPGPPTGNPLIVDGYPIVWTQYTITLSGLPAAGVSGRFAFRYFVEDSGLNGPHGNVVGVDDLDYVSAGSGGTCYANCDNSTNAPCLNVNDFVCFNNAFSAGLPYANCDASTINPTLNVNDFVCFNNAYSAGCTNPCSPRP
jgi:hypothetical protein